MDSDRWAVIIEVNPGWWAVTPESALALRNPTEGDITLLGEHEDLATLPANLWAFEHRTMVASPKDREVKGWAVVVRASSEPRHPYSASTPKRRSMSSCNCL